MSRSLLLGLMAGAAALGAAYFLMSPGTPDGNMLPIASANAQEAAADSDEVVDVDTSTIIEMSIGSEDAPVTVVEYASFTCGHCGNFHREGLPQIQADYIDTGKVRLIYREVYFDRPGLWASMLARCGGEERFFGISKQLYRDQSTWLAANDPTAIAAELERIGKISGLEQEEISACLKDGDKALTLVTWYQENAEKDEIKSTPTFIVGDSRIEGNNVAKLREVLDAALAGE